MNFLRKFLFLTTCNVLFFAGLSAHAAVFQVNSLNDERDAHVGDGLCKTRQSTCTLRAAIQEANFNPALDTVALPAGRFSLRLRGQGEDNALTGDLDVLQSVVIRGAGAGNTIIDGIAADRIFHIRNNRSAVTFLDLSLTNGLTPQDGGAVKSSALSLIVRKVTFSNNQSALGGGALSTSGPLTHVEKSTFADNSSTDRFDGHGGAIKAWDTLLVTDTVFQGNSAAQDGGAIADGHLSIISSSFLENEAGGSGGALSSLRFAVDRGTFTQNRASHDGGAVYDKRVDWRFDEELPEADLLNTIKGSQFVRNESVLKGGAIALYSGELSSVGVFSNSAGLDNIDGGGGAYIGGNALVKDSTFEGNKAQWGGGIHVAGEARIVNTYLTRNQASFGGGMKAEPGSKYLIEGSFIRENTAKFQGGGLFSSIDDNDGVISNAIIYGNSANKGGGAYGAFTISESEITGNRALNRDDQAFDAEAQGGGIFALDYGLTLVEHSTISGNTSEGKGGGIFVRGNFGVLNFTLLDSTVANNTATEAGGGVYNGLQSREEAGLVPFESSRIIGSTIKDNSARLGGGLYNLYYPNGFVDVQRAHVAITVINSTFSSNSAVENGGGIYTYPYLALISSTVTGNTLSDPVGANAGAGVFSDVAEELRNVTSLRLGRSIVYGNNQMMGVDRNNQPIWAPSNCHSIIVGVSYGHNLLGNDAPCIRGGANEIIGIDPLLEGLGDNGGPTQTHALRAGSPAIDAIPEARCELQPPVAGFETISDFILQDQRAIERPAGQGCDIGAFERI